MQADPDLQEGAGSLAPERPAVEAGTAVVLVQAADNLGMQVRQARQAQVVRIAARVALQTVEPVQVVQTAELVALVALVALQTADRPALPIALGSVLLALVALVLPRSLRNLVALLALLVLPRNLAGSLPRKARKLLSDRSRCGMPKFRSTLRKNHRGSGCRPCLSSADRPAP